MRNRKTLRCDGMSRRSALQIGQLAGLGIGLTPALSSSVAATTTSASAKNCILIWLDGGPSHLETFDLKPEASAEVRGPLNSISTAVAGISVSECLPGIASRMNDIAIIRSMTSPLGEHNLGTHYLMTGYKPSPVLEYPAFSCAAANLGMRSRSVLPTNVAIPEFRVGGGRFTGHGFLSSEFSPFSVGSDPAKEDFCVRDVSANQLLNPERLTRRRRYAEHQAIGTDKTGNSAETLPAAMAQAFNMVTSAKVRQAFDLQSESSQMRAKYGPRTVGQSCLLARRLIEHGVRFVTVNHTGWDTHEDLYTRLKEGFTGAKTAVGLIPSLDLAVSALIDDLRDRNLLNETLIVIMGEFGRTPKINTRGGRDHWPRVFSVALAGGGVRGGQVIGASDRTGESPADRPVTPADLACTIYDLLGLEGSTELRTASGRPVRLASNDSSVISELLG